MVVLYSHLNNLPLTGRNPAGDAQATVDELSNLIMPVVNHSEIVEIGFSVTYLPMDSDPELYEVRKIWVRTIHDESRQPHELGLWVPSHPTFGDILFGLAETDLGRSVDALWNALRDSRYRDAVLRVFGYGNVTISRDGITVRPDEGPFDEDWR